MNDEHQIFKPYTGKFILEQLERFGSSISHTHEFTFWLYFPTKELAQKASKQAIKSGFDVDISFSDYDKLNPQWLCLLFCPHIPDEELLDAISRFCLKLASDFNGKYDGWETKMELPEGTMPDLPAFKDSGSV